MTSEVVRMRRSRSAMRRCLEKGGCRASRQTPPLAVAANRDRSSRAPTDVQRRKPTAGLNASSMQARQPWRAFCAPRSTDATRKAAQK
jgi:hypothetical protein